MKYSTFCMAASADISPKKIVDTGKLDDYVQQIKEHEADPYSIVSGIIKDMLK